VLSRNFSLCSVLKLLNNVSEGNRNETSNKESRHSRSHAGCR